MKSLAGKWTETAIFGKTGIDNVHRIFLLRTLRQRIADAGDVSISPADQDALVMNFIKGTLPIDYGERFLRYPGWLTASLGVLFIAFLPREIVVAALSVHSFFGSPLTYAILLIQWVVFYLVMSALAAGIVSLVAFLSYGRRLSKPRQPSLEE